MTKQFWINLPVKDVARSRAFFSSLGFTFNTAHGNTDDSACLLIGENHAVVMLFTEPQMENFMRSKIADTKQGSEVLLSFDAESREEVDEFAQKAVAAGGTLYAEPAEFQGWMYGCGFADPDGHRWNVLFMDMEKMPKPQ
jgi:predicted lactoylglutathione lyase